MQRAFEVKPRGTWCPPAGRSLGARSVTLAFDERHRRRIRMTDDDGAAFLLDLPDAVLLADGDGLVLEDGTMIAVHAADEAVADIHCDDAATVARIAWHIGNRHTPLQVLESGALRIHDDHVMVEMVQGLGASVTRLSAPFEPEGGAYAAGHGVGHGGGHGHGDHHAQGKGAPAHAH